jgi:hypothetical protein
MTLEQVQALIDELDTFPQRVIERVKVLQREE